MKYQWYKDGFVLVGETRPVLNFQPFYYRNEGNYCCRVENSAGDALSHIAVLQAGRSFFFHESVESLITLWHEIFSGFTISTSPIIQLVCPQHFA